jgi:transposase
MKASKATLKKSLEGRITKHHQFMLKLLKQSITDKENLITTLDEQIDEASKEYAVEIELLQTIPGVGKQSAVSILSEVVGDMEVFSTEHHLSSWAGMSPGNNESGGKKKHKNHPWQQIFKSHIGGMRLGRQPNKRNLFTSKIR